jgi:hypothetical protein
MQEAIKCGTGHDGIAGKDMSPFGEGFVGGDNDGSVFLISVADNLEEQGSSGGIQAEVADFIDDCSESRYLRKVCQDNYDGSLRSNGVRAEIESVHGWRELRICSRKRRKAALAC